MPVSELVAAANNPLTAAPGPLQEAIQGGSAIVSFPPASERGAATTSYLYPPVAEVCACEGGLAEQSQVLPQPRRQESTRRRAKSQQQLMRWSLRA